MKTRGDTDSPAPLRIDKWLWAARFFKTRALAQQAVEGGKVRLNGERCKCSRELRLGDRLHIRVDELEWQVTVLGLSAQRGPAPVARRLYEEAPESVAARERRIAERRQAVDPGSHIHGRPTKRDRRLLHRFNESP
ncbi:MAG: RNA-binding S4 domain-containing protein [Pseudomonadota bacterium]